MRTRFNLVGDTFTHLTNGNKGYSVHGKESKYIKWVKDHPLAEGTFYIDNTINDGIGDGRKGLKYLWLLESKHIKPGLVESIIDNKQLVEDTYETILLMISVFWHLVISINGFPHRDFGSKNPKFMKKPR